MNNSKRVLLIIILSIIFLIPFSSSALPKLFSSKSSSVNVITQNIFSNFTNFTQLLDVPSTYVGSNGLCLIVNATSNKIYFGSCSSASGDITSVVAGTGLFGGGLTGDVTLNISASICSAGEVSKYNGTGFVCVTDSVGSANASFNQSLTDTLYASIIWNHNQTPIAGNNITVSGRTVGLNGTSLKNWLDTLYQTIGSYLLVSDLPLINRTISHWDNVTNKPANLDIDSTNDLLITNLPLHNRTLVNCLNITGADADFCNDATGGSSYKGDGIYLYNDSTTMYFNQTKENITINSLIDLDELHYNSSIPDQSYTDTKVSTANLHLHSILNITGVDDNICNVGDFVVNVTFNNGNLQIVCATPSGSGDITSVQGDIYITNGSNTGAVNLIFNETKLNNTISNLGVNIGFNSTYNITYNGLVNNDSYLSTYNSTYNNILNQMCPSGKVVNGTLANGTIICIAPTLSESDPIFLNENVSLWTEAKNKYNGTYNNLLNQSCPSGQAVNGTLSNGTIICKTFLTSYTETDPIFSANFTNMQTDCPTGNYSYGVLSNGTFKCRSDTTGSTIYTNGTGILLNNNQFNLSTSYTDTLYASILLGYNQTIATFNQYGLWWYNQTTPAITYANTNFNYTSILNNLTSTDCPAGQLVIGVQNNGTVLCAIDSQGTANASFNQSLTDTLYAGIEWDYNQTISAITDINSRFWNTTQSWNRTQLYNITQIDNFNASWTTTYNDTYKNLLGKQCPVGQVVNGTLINGTFTCITDANSGGGNPFNQVLNTSNNVSFARVTLNSNNSDYDQLQFINSSGSVTLTFSSEQTINYLIGDLYQQSGYFSSDQIDPSTSVGIIGNAGNPFLKIHAKNITAIDTLNATKICLSNDCKTSWPSGSADGTGSWVNDSIQTNTSVNVNILTGHNITSNWFKGLFNWTALNNWLNFDGTTLSFNETKLNNTISNLGVNIGFNSTYNVTYNGLINNNSYLSTYNETYAGLINNVSYLSTYNATYNVLLNQSCPVGKIVNGTLINGTFTCTTDQTAIADFTNVSYLNNTQTFRGVNTFINSIEFKDTGNTDTLGHIYLSSGAWDFTFGDWTGAFGATGYFKVNVTDSYANGNRIGIWLYNQTTPAQSYADTNFLKLSGGQLTGNVNTSSGSNITIKNDSTIFYGTEKQASIYWDKTNNRLVMKVS